MKIAKIIPIAILCLIISVTIVSATHTSSVTITPSGWTKSTEKAVSLTVTNTNGDSITKVELTVPETSDQVPIYSIKETTTPSVCTDTYTKRTGQFYPYKITWTCSGIDSGKSLTFGLTVVSPSSSGDYKWNWKTTDKNNGNFTGFTTTNVGQAPVSYFVISAPTTSVAGSSFKINVRAFGDDNQVKTDYTGKVSFSSTDLYAVLPSDYTFKASDYGSKDFSIAYKTTGSQSFTVRDASLGISKESIKTSVKPGTTTDIGISPEDKKVLIGEKVEFKLTGKDALGNLFDLTDKATFTINKEASGSWNKSVYTTEKEGTWIVIASYSGLMDATTLTVSKEAVKSATVKEEINITPEVTPPAGVKKEMSISGEDSLKIAPGANDTIVLTVSNTGDSDLTGVEISFSGVPTDWITTYPLTTNIEVGKSKDYLVIISVPENETEEKTITFTASSSEGVKAEKSLTLSMATAPTGLTSIPKNVLQLGVVIIAVAAVVIIAWELWFKKPKSK
jgi:hypothetical protein